MTLIVSNRPLVPGGCLSWALAGLRAQREALSQLSLPAEDDLLTRALAVQNQMTLESEGKRITWSDPELLSSLGYDPKHFLYLGSLFDTGDRPLERPGSLTLLMIPQECRARREVEDHSFQRFSATAKNGEFPVCASFDQRCSLQEAYRQMDNNTRPFLNQLRRASRELGCTIRLSPCAQARGLVQVKITEYVHPELTPSLVITRVAEAFDPFSA